MAQAGRTPALERASRAGFPAWLAGTPAITFGVFALGFLSYLALMALVGGDDPRLRGLPEASAGLLRRHAAVISLLLGFTLASRLRAWRALPGTLHSLARLLPEGAEPPTATPARLLAGPARAAAIAIGGAAGWLIVIASVGGVAGFRQAWGAHTLWASLANVLLFAQMALLAGEQLAADRLIDRELTARIRVPLLETEALAPYAGHGLRNALYWFVGSSIASLLFLNWGFSWTMLVVTSCTLGIGTLALLIPARRLHQRVRQAKALELARVRERVDASRTAALAGDDAAAARLPGLLAWEARVVRVPEWPFDVSSLLRFAALASLAIGSWLGGAVVERLLGLAIGG